MRAPRAVRVLVLVEDPGLGEVLVELLAAGGWVGQPLAGLSEIESALAAERPHGALVDLDTRARDGGAAVAALRRLFPAATIVALAPCGGLLPHDARLAAGCDRVIEKPVRLQALLAALGGREERDDESG